MSGPVVLPVTPLSQNSAKFWPTYFLALFFGVFGAHRFYLKSPKRFLMLLTLGGFGLWAFVDFIVILLGRFKDESGNRIANPERRVSWTIWIVLFAIAFGRGSSVTIEGDTGKMTFSASAIQTPLLCGGDLADAIWTAARDNKEIKRLEVRVLLADETPIDSYGKADPRPYVMGTVFVSNLEEVRKYEKSSYWFAYRDVYGDKIGGMKYGNLFRGK